MEVQVPEAVDVSDLVGTGLAQGEGLAVGMLAMAALAGPQEALLLHEPAHGRVPGDRREARVLARERDEVVVVKLEGPSRMVAVLLRDRFGHRGAERSGGYRRARGPCVRGRRVDWPAPRAMYHQRSMVLNEKRIVSPVVGCLHGRRGERLDVRFELAIVGRGGEQRARGFRKRRRAHRTRALGAWSSLAMGLRRAASRGAPQREGPYAGGENTGQRHLLRERRGPTRLHHGPHPSRPSGSWSW